MIYDINKIYLSGLIVSSGHCSFLGINAISPLGYVSILENDGCSIHLSGPDPIDTLTLHDSGVGNAIYIEHCNNIITIMMNDSNLMFMGFLQ